MTWCCGVLLWFSETQGPFSRTLQGLLNACMNHSTNIQLWNVKILFFACTNYAVPLIEGRVITTSAANYKQKKQNKEKQEFLQIIHCEERFWSPSSPICQIYILVKGLTLPQITLMNTWYNMFLFGQHWTKPWSFSAQVFQFCCCSKWLTQVKKESHCRSENNLHLHSKRRANRT